MNPTLKCTRVRGEGEQNSEKYGFKFLFGLLLVAGLSMLLRDIQLNESTFYFPLMKRAFNRLTRLAAATLVILAGRECHSQVPCEEFSC